MLPGLDRLCPCNSVIRARDFARCHLIHIGLPNTSAAFYNPTCRKIYVGEYCTRRLSSNGNGKSRSRQDVCLLREEVSARTETLFCSPTSHPDGTAVRTCTNTLKGSQYRGEREKKRSLHLQRSISPHIIACTPMNGDGRQRRGFA